MDFAKMIREDLAISWYLVLLALQPVNTNSNWVNLCTSFKSSSTKCSKLDSRQFLALSKW
ncbi:hypothetical protein WICPIJ_001956 [Wickerhamomyces pijperi]|uniref:Uncharacterized protein n=1 Tax=Wickerhamomyces pijperi TaxID=599730 RepID=A0A9P8TPE2_WICPI|nr:hypothetical protein WICPIJ_001956 [Wickerhamomyces pijperi]